MDPTEKGAQPAQTEPEIDSADVPQEDNLGDVRRTVHAIADGLEDTQSIAERTGRSKRHVGYAINAAFVLGWIEIDEKLSVLEDGKALLAQPENSAGERAVEKSACESSEILRLLAPDMFAEIEPVKSIFSERIQRLAGLAKSTADRRAQTLLAWRRQILGK
jgi:hypothetical protein